METTFTAMFVMLLTACAGGGAGLFDPSVISANERYITLRDEIGIPGRVEKMANAHCQKQDRVAQFQSKGGAGWQCGGRNSNLCSTYACAN